MRAARILPLAVVLASMALWMACPGGDVCPCNLCPSTSAIDMTVVEAETQNPIEDFFVEVIRDGLSEGEPLACQENFREGNRCEFGDDAGVYIVVVQAPGYETLEVSTRVATEAESELCCRACLSAKNLRVEMTPVSDNG